MDIDEKREKYMCCNAGNAYHHLCIVQNRRVSLKLLFEQLDFTESLLRLSFVMEFPLYPNSCGSF